MYELNNAHNQPFIFLKLIMMRYKDGTPMAEHLNYFQGLINQLEVMDIKLGERVHALILLGSLPESWETIVVTLSHSTPGGNLTLKMVKDGALNEENRRKEQGFVTQSQTLVTENRERSKSRTPRNRDNDKKSRGRCKSMKEISCFHCGKPMHKKFQCRKFKRE
ncbi:hypothetical protein LWI28_008915 [Acer negundo]|uniref:CCHC-type domain-containing protein n=1 Tax=Acer negundo TaxID=4023 RepID=A0AAD5NLH6_ACENE|nr:hypothetical protein LWI28_008915 [Acer negundo]